METPVMVDQNAAADSGPSTSANVSPGVRPGLAAVISILRASRVSRTLAVVTTASVLVIIAGAYGQLRIVYWNKPFLDAFGRRDFRGYMFELGVFIFLAVFMLFVNTAQRWLGEILKIHMREALVRDLLHHWMRPGWASAFAHSDPIGATPTQHVHEDARRLSGLSVDLGLGLLQALTMTVTFFGLLWSLSAAFPVEMGNRKIVLHGFLAWSILAYSLVASLIGLWVGRAVIRRGAELSARESDFADLLERTSNHIDAISFAAGERHEAQRLTMALESVLAGMRRSAASVSNFTMVTGGFGWIARVAPTLAALPLFLSGLLSFGNFLVVSLASIQLQSSLDWFVGNFPAVAEWRAALDRVLRFRRAGDVGAGANLLAIRISFVEGAPGRMRFANLSTVTPSGTMEMSERQVEIRRGDQVLIMDDSAVSDVPPLFRVLAGVWPWGDGTVVRPAGESMMFVPLTPYLPSGTLRHVLTYPAIIEPSQGGDVCAGVLVRLGLERVVGELDATRDWDRLLDEEERRRIAFARAVLGKPNWLIVDQMFDMLDRRLLEPVLAVLAAELPNVTLIHFSRRKSSLRIFNRVLHMRRTPMAGRRAR
jgi:vitamin B12/bleomycin/antimicrobial peptide transport system ATP-binding/permease protein